MKRRNFLTGAGMAAGAAAFASGVAKPAIAQDRLEWKMVTSWPKGLPGLGTGAERLAERITKASDGRLTVKVFAAGELVPATGCFDAVSQGTAEMGHDASNYHIDRLAAAGFFCSVPMGLTAGELNGWAISAAARNCGTSSTRRSTSSRSWPATPARRWAAGSARRSTRSATSKD